MKTEIPNVKKIRHGAGQGTKKLADIISFVSIMRRRARSQPQSQFVRDIKVGGLLLLVAMVYRRIRRYF